MNHSTLARLLAFVLLASVLTTTQAQAADQAPPNIVFILADDMGYGDVRAYNAESKVPTPHLDKLAEQGMRFTDAHSPSAVCTPTRYGTLTGRYCWRTRLKRGVLGGYSEPLIDRDQSTVATMLGKHGYHTAAIGKWHLGMDLPKRSGANVQQQRWDGDGNVDYAGKIADGPTTRGFDYYFGNSASLDMAPYVWIENDRFTSIPTIQQAGVGFPDFIRKGPRSEDFVIHNVLDTLGDKAAAYIKERAKRGKPFFLYIPLTAPHKPVTPHPRFEGKSKAGRYGDFVMNVDAVVGKVVEAIDAAKIADETLLIFTSDNGNFMYELKPGEKGHLADASVQGYLPTTHRANHIWRGTKADVYEAGHRVPFIVRWPGKVKAGATRDETITHTDFYATAAAVVGAELARDEAEDSFSLLPLLTGSGKWQRAPVINHSAAGMFAIRDGKWKLIAGNGSGGRQAPKGQPFGKPYQLYDLDADPGETINLIDKHADIARVLEEKLTVIREGGRSR